MKKLILFIMSIVVIAGLYFYYNNSIKITSSEDEISSIMNSLKNYFTGYSENFDNQIIINNNSSFIWLSNDGYNIFVPSTPGIELNIIVNSSGLKEEAEVIKDVENYNSIIKNELEFRGFKVSELNTSNGENFDRQGRFLQAFEKSDIKCLSSTKQWPFINTETNKYYNILEFSCNTDKKIQDNYTLQKPFFDVLEKENNEKREYIYIWGLDIDEETASASVHAFLSGYSAYFYKSEDGWRLINAGQAQPFCSDLEARGVPKKYWNCRQ